MTKTGGETAEGATSTWKWGHTVYCSANQLKRMAPQHRALWVSGGA